MVSSVFSSFEPVVLGLLAYVAGATRHHNRLSAHICMDTVLVPINILLSAPATGKAAKILAVGRWLVLLLFDKYLFNAYLQGVRRSVLFRHSRISYWFYPYWFTSFEP